MADTEKITVNLSVVDLGKIDLLVAEGFYSNRTDLVRSAIRNEVARHDEALRQSCTRLALTLGVVHYDGAALQRRLSNGERLHIRVVGMAIIDPDVPPELAAAAIASIKVFGVLRATKPVRQALAGRLNGG